MAERPTRRPSSTTVDAKALDRVYQRLETILGRMDGIDERIDGLGGRLSQIRDESMSKETEIIQRMSQMREGVTHDISAIKKDLDKLKESNGANAAAEGAAAGAARGVAESTIPDKVISQAIAKAAKSRWGMTISIGSGFLVIVSVVTILPKVFRFFADIGPAIAYWLGGSI